MASARNGRIRSVALGGCALTVLLLCSCRPFDFATVVNYFERDHHHELESCATPTVAALAHDVDALEGYIEKYGSVVTKQPDVWGQARLTKHRQEFEQQFVGQLSAFDFTLQGSVAQSDQAYFADALALSAAASGGNAPAGAATSSSSTAVAQQPSSAAPSPQPPSPSSIAMPADFSNVFGAFGDMKRTPLQNGISLDYAGANHGITVEPTVLLDQRARFLNHLHELRRINEGDDTADSPGYALNLVRIPVSILPGKLTQIGRCAEVTITLKPCLSENLLDVTFRNLVLNDLVDQLGFPVTQFINNPDNKPYFTDLGGRDLDELLAYLDSTSLNDVLTDSLVRLRDSRLAEFRYRPGIEKLFSRPEWAWVDADALTPPGFLLQLTPEQKQIFHGYAQPPDASGGPPLRPALGQKKDFAADAQPNRAATQAIQQHPLEMQRIVGGLRQSVRKSYVSIPVPATKARRARMPFPATELSEVYGFDFHRVVVDAYRRLSAEPYTRPRPDSNQVYIHLPDVQGYLQEQIWAAYEFLRQPVNQDLWPRFCRPDLAVAVPPWRSDKLPRPCSDKLPRPSAAWGATIAVDVTFE